MVPLCSVLENELKGSDEEEEEGEQFDFDSGDEIPEADRQALVPPASDSGINVEHEDTNSTGEPLCPVGQASTAQVRIKPHVHQMLFMLTKLL